MLGIKYLCGGLGEREVKTGHCINGSIQKRPGFGHLSCVKDGSYLEVLMVLSEYGYDNPTEAGVKKEELN